MPVPSVERARLTAWLLEDPAPIAAEWITAQRWFGGKARPIDRLAVTDVAWLPGPSNRALVIVAVHHGGNTVVRGEPVEQYALLVDVAAGAGPTVIARVPWHPELALVEAGAEGDAVRAVVAVLVDGAPVPGVRGGELRATDVSGTATGDLAARRESIAVKAVGAEQSNTSLRIGTGFVLKLIRKIQEGEHPQLEIGRFLARAGFRYAPPLHGSLTYHSADGGRFAVVALEGWVDNSGDGWSHVLNGLEHGPIGPLREDIFHLGGITAAFHAALAADRTSPDFAPEPVSAEDLAQWREAVSADAARLLKIAAQDHARWPAPAAVLGATLLSRRDQLLETITAIDLHAGVSEVRKIRVHGDFHLGQTLKTAEGFVLIDFEGEPARPLQERRQKQCALKDVAGLLRSLDYAEATATQRTPAAAGAGAILRRAFLDGYYGAPSLGSFLPRDEESSRPLLALFELEKALYEVEYELNNRPGWLHIPLGAIVGRLAPT